MPLCKKILILITMAALSACSMPKPENRENEGNNDHGATFFIESSDGDVISEVVHQSISFPKSKNFRFTTCVKDVAYSKPLTQYPFTIKELGKDIKSDAKGCLVWNEDIEFNALATPHYLQIERTIQANGLHKGSRKMKLAINPWVDGKESKNVIDTSKKISVPELVQEQSQIKLKLMGEPHESRNMWINEARLTVVQKHFVPGAIKLDVGLSTRLFVELLNMNRTSYKKPITEADVTVEMHIIQVRYETKDGKTTEHRRALTNNKSGLKPVHISNGEMVAETELTLPKNATEGKLLLGIKVNVLNQPESLSKIKEFHGIFIMGGFHQMIGRTYLNQMSESMKRQDDETFTIENYLSETEKAASDDGSITAQVRVEELMIKFRGHGTEKENRRETKFLVKACFQNGVDLRNVQGQTFKIKHMALDPQSPAKGLVDFSHDSEYIKQDKMTLTDSCISWEDSFSYQTFACSRLVKGHINIQNENLAVNMNLPIAINPWEPHGEYARDLRPPYSTESELSFKCDAPEAHKPRVFVKNYATSATLPSYKLWPDFTVSFHIPIRLTLYPSMKTYTLRDGRYTSEEIRPGIYLLKTAILRPISELNQGMPPLITWKESLVKIIGSTIVQELEYELKDAFSLGNLNNLLVEIYPVDLSKVREVNDKLLPVAPTENLSSLIDRKSEFISPTYEGVFSFNRAGDSENMIESSNTQMAASLLGLNTNSSAQNSNIIDRLIIATQKIEKEKAERNKPQALAKQLLEKGVVLVDMAQPKTTTDFAKALTASYRLQYHSTSIEKRSHNSSAYRSLARVSQPIENEFIRGFVNTKQGSLTVEQAQVLCPYFVDIFFEQNFQFALFNPNARSEAVQLCLASVKQNPNEVFKSEYKLDVRKFNASRDQSRNQNVQESFQVNAQFNKQISHNTSRAEQVQGGIKVPGFVSKIPFIGYAFDFVSAQHNYSNQMQEQNTVGHSVSLNNQKHFIADIVNFNIDVSEFRVCKMIRMNHDALMKSFYREKFLGMSKYFVFKNSFDRVSFYDYLNQQLPVTTMASLGQAGLLICDDKVKKQNLSMKESFYIVSENIHFAAALHTRDPLSRGIFTTLRGTPDFNRFKRLLKDNILMPGDFSSKDEVLKDQFQKVQEAFEQGVGTLPGFLDYSKYNLRN